MNARLSTILVLLSHLCGLASPAGAQYAITDLGTLENGGLSYANAINASGQVVGLAKTSEGDLHAFLWQNGKMTDLGTLPGGSESQATDINSAGQIVGSSKVDDEIYHAFVWQNGVMRDLGIETGFGSAQINESGQITGTLANG